MHLALQDDQTDTKHDDKLSTLRINVILTLIYLFIYLLFLLNLKQQLIHIITQWPKFPTFNMKYLAM